MPLTKVQLVRSRNLTKGGENPFSYRRKMKGGGNPFSDKRNMLILFTPVIFYTHLLYLHIIFLAHTYFSLHIYWPIIHVIFSFGRIIIDIIVYGRKRKTCINVLLSFSIHILSFAHTLTYNSCHFFFWKDNNWYHCL